MARVAPSPPSWRSCPRSLPIAAAKMATGGQNQGVTLPAVATTNLQVRFKWPIPPILSTVHNAHAGPTGVRVAANVLIHVSGRVHMSSPGSTPPGFTPVATLILNCPVPPCSEPAEGTGKGWYVCLDGHRFRAGKCNQCRSRAFEYDGRWRCTNRACRQAAGG